ncbi:MAG: hypothetical protein KAR39_10840 [Thermoplasmata archaeon]|nr:hypothetical protein [Thermoplasmata archaeon]
MKFFWRKALVEEDNGILEGLTTYVAYLSLIVGLVLLVLSVRNFRWSKRFEAGECPFPVKDPEKMLLGFKKVPFVGSLLLCSLVMLMTGIILLASRLTFPTSDLLFEALSVPFVMFSLSIFFFATYRYFIGFLFYVERLASSRN